MTTSHSALALVGAVIALAGAGYAVLTVEQSLPRERVQVSDLQDQAVSGAVVAAGEDGRGGGRAQNPELRRDITLLSNEVKALKAQIRTLNATVGALPTPGELAALKADIAGRSASVWDPPSGTSDDGPLGGEEASSQDLLAREKEATRLRMDTVEAAFQGERVDRRWAARAKEAIWSATQEMPSGVQVFDVQCRFTMCRLDLEHAGAAARARFEGEFLAKIGEMFPRMTMDYTEHDDGSTEATVYLVRSGYKTPATDPL